jgi:hypothetical protein
MKATQADRTHRTTVPLRTSARRSGEAAACSSAGPAWVNASSTPPSCRPTPGQDAGSGESGRVGTHTQDGPGLEESGAVLVLRAQCACTPR